MHDVFISYSKSDNLAADAACAALENAGIRCWIAPRNVHSGYYWAEQIVNAIDDCRVMVLIFSAAANISSQVLREVEKAIRKGTPIHPVRIENVEPTKSMEHFLHSLHWLDALTPPLERHLQILCKDVKAYLDNHSEPDRADNGPQSEIDSGAVSASDIVRSPREGGSVDKQRQPFISPIRRHWWPIAALLALLAICGSGAIYFLASSRVNCETASDCNELGHAYNDKKQWDDAIRAFKKAIDLDSNAADYLNLGWAYNGKHEWDLAVNAFSKTIQLDPNPNDPNLAAAFVDRGYAYAAQKNWSRAIADYDEAIRVDPEYASAFYYRGESKQALGDTLGSQADKAEAHKINPKDF
jgi:tetratricopeptide (TPR) repeat protein